MLFKGKVSNLSASAAKLSENQLLELVWGCQISLVLDQVGGKRGLPSDRNAGEPMVAGSAQLTGGQGLPCSLVIGKSALQADLIILLICNHLT